MGKEFKRDLLQDGHEPAEVEAIVERSRARFLGAPAAVLVCTDLSVMDNYPDPQRQIAEYQMAVQSTAMAGALLLLAAHAEGLGGVWVCGPLFAPQAARLALELPCRWEPQGLVLLGYPEKLPGPRPRQALTEVARFL
jgi:coenzyme F420-0:L-glutamate ligase / coenzyme F420-1:gamma-L-glutamate ligase